MQFSTTAPSLVSLPDDLALTRSELAPLIGVIPHTIYIWSRTDKGPKVTRINGKPRYLVTDVRSWLADRERSV